MDRTTMTSLWLSIIIALAGAGILGFWVFDETASNEETADIVLINGKVISVDPQFGIYSGTAIKGEKILAIGSDPEILSLQGDHTRVIDLKQHTVIPGLIDNHVHPIPASVSELTEPLPDLMTIQDLLDWIHEQAMRKPPGEWIVHPKFFFSRLKERRWPSKEELDRVAPDHPVFLNGSYGGMVNTKAIIQSKLEQTNHPGLLTDHKTKKLTGIIRRSAFGLLQMDPPPARSQEEKLNALKNLFHKYNTMGITSITAGSGRTADLELMHALNDRGELTVRVFQNILLPFKPDATLEEMKSSLAGLAYHTGQGNEWVKVGALKAVMDGGILTGTAFMREPWGERAGEIYGFSSPEYRGGLFIGVEELTRIITAAYDAGWKFTAHVTGGGGVDTLLRAMEMVHRSRPLQGRRFSIIHGNFFTKDAIKLMNTMDIYADMQPMWLYKDIDLLRNVLDKEVLSRFHPYRTMVDDGIRINGGSDHMVKLDPNHSINPYNPFLSIYTLISRKSENGTVFLPGQILSRTEALRLYTINNAYATFEEAQKGSIEPGKWADIVVLSDDIMTCNIDQIPKIHAVMTMVGGGVVYDKGVIN